MLRYARSDRSRPRHCPLRFAFGSDAAHMRSILKDTLLNVILAATGAVTDEPHFFFGQ